MNALLAVLGALVGVLAIGGGGGSSDETSSTTSPASRNPDADDTSGGAANTPAASSGPASLSAEPQAANVVEQPDPQAITAPSSGQGVEIPQVSNSAYNIGWAGLSAEEQLVVELVNRARLDPRGENARQEDGFAEGVTTAPKEALAVNRDLSDAAEGHSQDMVDRDFFSHTNPDGQSASARAMEEGFPGGAGENIGFIGGFSVNDPQGRVQSHHDNLWESDGHQQNFMSTSYSEIGVGYVYGDFEYEGQNYPASTLLTQNLSDQGNTYLTGVVIDDRDGDDFYDLGEGQGGVRVTAYNDTGVYTTSTYDAGGYTLELDEGTYDVVFHGGDLDGIFETTVTIGRQNVKLDVIEDEDAEDLDLLFV